MSSFGYWETLYFYFYIQANGVNIKTSSWFFCCSCKNFLLYNLLYVCLLRWCDEMGKKTHWNFALISSVFFFLQFFLLWRHFHMIRWLQTITRMKRMKRTQQQKMKKKKYKNWRSLHTKCRCHCVRGFTTVIKFYHSFYDTLCHFFIRHLFLLCTLKALSEDVLS